MDELFNIEKMENSIKKAKKRTTRKMVLISVLTVLLLGGATVLGVVINDQFVQKAAGEIDESFQYFDDVAGPNEFVGITEMYHGFLGGESRFKKYKWINGKLVLSSEGSYNYGFLRDQKTHSGRVTYGVFGGAHTEEDVQDVHYNEQGHRIMTFFYPQMQYKQVSDDLALLATFPDDLLVEMALSFDKGYSVAASMQLLPQSIQPAWFWVNDVTHDTDSYMHVYDVNTEIDKIPLVRNAENVYGFSLLDDAGQVIENPTKLFIDAISEGSLIESRWQTEFKRLQETIGKDGGRIEESDIVINGVVVTGTAEELRVLAGAPYVKASSLGVVTEQY